MQDFNRFFKIILLLILPQLSTNKAFSQVKVNILYNQKINSKSLNREVIFDVILPPNYDDSPSKFKTLYMNDGQDLKALKMEETLNKLYNESEMQSFILVAVHTNQNRIREYGTAKMADYKNRGDLANDYNSFVINELVPYISEKHKSSTHKDDNYFCGFSLGGLSAMDIVWHNPEVFSKVGVFSGSFWWRKKAYEDGYDDHNDRIMHVLVREKAKNEGQKFWFECGTNDEKDDRNGNGIIDSIDDTLDLIKELENKGYKNGIDITYYEVKDGEHNLKTWSEAMPAFLKWLLN